MMQDIMQEVGGDGFLFFNGYFDRRYIMEVCDGLVPELQRRGADAERSMRIGIEGQSAGVLARGWHNAGCRPRGDEADPTC